VGSTDISPVATAGFAVQLAANLWNQVVCGNNGSPNVQIQRGSDYPGSDDGGDGNNVIYWVKSNWGSDSSSVALTSTSYYTDTGYAITSDMAFNNVNFSFFAKDGGGVRHGCAATGSGASSCFEVLPVALHEFGHFLGLDHVACPTAVMYPQGNPNSVLSALSLNEQAGICALYPPRLQAALTPRDFGESCSTTTACADGFSCILSAGGPGWCSFKCGTDDDCPAGYACSVLNVDGQTAVQFCKPGLRSGGTTSLPPNTTNDLCKPCTDGTDCSTNLCAVESADSSVGLCTGACSRTTPPIGYCPIGMDCVPGGTTGSELCWPRTGFDPASAFVLKGLNADCYDGAAWAANECEPDLFCFHFAGGTLGEVGSCVDFCNDTTNTCQAGYTCCYGLDANGNCVTTPPAGPHRGGCFKIGIEGDAAVIPNQSVCAVGATAASFNGDANSTKCYRTCETQQCAAGQTCLQFSTLGHNVCCNNGTGLANQPACLSGPAPNDRAGSGGGGCRAVAGPAVNDAWMGALACSLGLVAAGWMRRRRRL
jgi:hypothetical protein